MVLGGFRSFHVLVTTPFIHPALLNEGCDVCMYVLKPVCSNPKRRELEVGSGELPLDPPKKLSRREKPIEEAYEIM